jgi:hypothetical protein
MYPYSHATQRNWGARLRFVTYMDMRMVVMENEYLRLAFLADKGADLVELNYKTRDLDLVWLTPGGVRDPSLRPPTSDDPAALFLETYPGGWQEVFPSGGAPSEYGGARFGQHGEVFSLPWDVQVIEDTEDAVAVCFRVRTAKMPFVLQKTVRLASGERSFSFTEALTNESPLRLPVMWGHHITFGAPFLRPGCTIRLPPGIEAIPHPTDIAPEGRRIAGPHRFPWPNAPLGNNGVLDVSVIPESGTPSDLFYLTGFPETDAWYEIEDASRGVGARVEWDRDIMPYLWYWQEFGAHTGYPWFGRNFNIGLEPFSSFPTNGLAEAVDNGTALQVGPGETIHFRLQMTVIDSHDDVTPLAEGEVNV